MVFLGQVLLFSITGCPFCARTKKLLTELQVPYFDVNLEKYPERRYEMQERTGRRTVPQIFFNSKHIGGYDDIKKLVRERFSCTGLTLPLLDRLQCIIMGQTWPSICRCSLIRRAKWPIGV